jgi:hypothetical protein
MNTPQLKLLYWPPHGENTLSIDMSAFTIRQLPGGFSPSLRRYSHVFGIGDSEISKDSPRTIAQVARSWDRNLHTGKFINY